MQEVPLYSAIKVNGKKIDGDDYYECLSYLVCGCI